MNGVVMSVCLESGQASQALAKATRRTERVEAGLKSKSLCVLRHSTSAFTCEAEELKSPHKKHHAGLRSMCLPQACVISAVIRFRGSNL